MGGSGVAAVPRFAVVGHPVAHSRSPEIHAAFARETGVALHYGRLLAPLDGFATTVERFFADGGRGLNVTVPFKLEAHAHCGARISARAAQAGAVNVLACDAHGLHGDNTDGLGLVDDLVRLDATLGRVLLVGAGGAARGVIGPLLDAGVRALVVVNRDVAKARALVERFERPDALAATGFDAIDDAPFDVVVNATSAGLSGDVVPLRPGTLASAGLVYDMMYGKGPTAFLVAAEEAGARRTADGLGMLVAQAAESFRLWLGVKPSTAPVLARLRDDLRATR